MSSVFFDPTVGGDGSTVTDDANAATGLASGGHRSRFVPALANIVGIGNFAKTKAAEAAASAASAVLSPGTSATSATSLTIGYGVKSLTIETGKSIVAGMTVKVVNTITWADWVAGDVLAYNPSTGALSVNVLVTRGGGTYGGWVVSLAGPLNGDPLLKAGGAMTGYLELLADPVAALHAATKSYVDYHNLSQLVGRAANTAFTPAEMGTTFFLYASFTQTLLPVGAYPPGWWCRLRNDGVGIVILTPAAPDLVQGLSSIAIYPGEEFILATNGLAWYTIDRSVNPIISSGSFSSAANLTIAQPFSDSEIKSFELWMELLPGGLTNGMNATVGGWSGAAGHIRTYYEFSSSYTMSDRVTVSGATQLSGAGVATDRISLYAACLDIQNAGEKPRFNIDVAAVTSSVRRLRKNILQSTNAAVKPTSLTIDASQATMTGTYRIVGSRV